LDAWITFFGCPDVAAIAGALPDTINAAIAARDISLVLFNIKASHAPFPCTRCAKIRRALKRRFVQWAWLTTSEDIMSQEEHNRQIMISIGVEGRRVVRVR
jgi:hypothetical protein